MEKHESPYQERHYGGRRFNQYNQIRQDDNDDEGSSDSSSETITFTKRYKKQLPTNTFILHEIPKDITDSDILSAITAHCGLFPIRIQLNWKQVANVPRGTCFVEFVNREEAMQCMKMNKGVLKLKDKYLVDINYTAKEKHCNISTDWFCINCNQKNFKWRIACCKCNASRMESVYGGAGSDDVCDYVTKIIMLRNLDALTTEDSVTQILNTHIPDVMKKVSLLQIKRDPLTSTSLGICYMENDNIVDALALYSALINITPALEIDGKIISISYCKSSRCDATQVVERPVTTENISIENSIMNHQNNITNTAAARSATNLIWDTNNFTIPNGSDGKYYPIPDAANYIYDRNNEYWYDYSSGLYYDPSSNYYWNGIIQKYLYYDYETFTYLLAPSGTENTTGNDEYRDVPRPKKLPKNSKSGKIDKYSAERKVSRKMLHWIKRLNEKKELENKTSLDDVTRTNKKWYLDYTKCICHLCNRRLISPTALFKHSMLSELHKKNMAAHNFNSTVRRHVTPEYTLEQN